ncbi:DUF4136 domain-containing protein [Microbulbifer sp. SA54]|uniref:DUF4136 domain-containing protein n=1 Tax=Microbulbifer sp. SA54 TaxID=3401577 RepID=UPI003AACBA22
MRIPFAGLMAALLALAGLTGCSPTQVEKIQPRSAPVAFSTYAWGTEALSATSGSSAQLVELDAELRQVVGALMAARGYRQLDNPANADMVVDYQVAIIEEEFAGDPQNESWDAQFDSNAQANVVELPTRTGAPRVTLGVGIGPANGAAIWGGRATKLITRPEDKAERQRILDRAVAEILEDLPPAR